MDYLVLLLLVLSCTHFTIQNGVSVKEKEELHVNGGTTEIPKVENILPGPTFPPSNSSNGTTTVSPNSTTTIIPTTPTQNTTTPIPTTTTSKTTAKPTTLTPSTSSTPKPTVTTSSSTTTATSPTKSTAGPVTTAQPSPVPEPHRRFDGPSFVGGIVLALGLVAIGFVAFKFYKARLEVNYHTL